MPALLLLRQQLVASFPGLADFALAEGIKGLAGLVVDSVNGCDTDVRKDLYQHVVLSGAAEPGGRAGLRQAESVSE